MGVEWHEVEVQKIGSEQQWMDALKSGSPDDLVIEGLSAGECRDIVNTWRKLLIPELAEYKSRVAQFKANIYKALEGL
jgi:hypothetical protein